MKLISIYLFYMFKSLTPFSPFLVPFLIDTKKFKNKEIYNNLNIYFFISSLLISLVAFLILRICDSRISLFLDTLLEFLGCCILYMMDERNFFLGKLCSILHGSSTSLNSILKSAIASSSGDNNLESKVLMNNITIIKCIASVFSSWIGQDIFLRIKKYDFNLLINVSTLLVCLVLTMFIPQNNLKEVKKNSIISELSDNLELFSNFKIISNCLLNITANILVICLAFFSANIFIERRRVGYNRLNNVIFIIMAPFRYISIFLIKLYKILGGNPKESQDDVDTNKKEIVIHGYIDGISKICSALICYFMGRINIQETSLYKYSFCVILLSIFSLFFLYLVSSLSLSYIFFTIAFALSSSAKIILYSSFSSLEYKNFIFSVNMFVSSFIHIFLSYLSIYRKANIQQRFKYYIVTSILLMSFSLGLYCLNNFRKI
ncbi:transporter protein [Vairimorpha necatrix]|uniref:Transporter protein n=1 Tax=Vairimorpha necatrix TaxID=6039 RepID=A0AAX4J8B0_9MICR